MQIVSAIAPFILSSSELHMIPYIATTATIYHYFGAHSQRRACIHEPCSSFSLATIGDDLLQRIVDNREVVVCTLGAK